MDLKVFRAIMFSLPLFFIFNHVAAQLDVAYFPGTVQLKNGNTRRGFIKSDPIQKLNYRIVFKDSLNQNGTITLDTAVVNAVYIDNGEVYELLHFKTDDQTDSMAVLGNLTVSGSLNLYRVYHKGKAIYLLKNFERTFTLQDDELISLSAVETIKHNFKKQLDTAFLHNAKFIADINRLSYNEKEIVTIVSKYNTESGSGNKVLKTKGSKANFLIAGITGGPEPNRGQEFNFSIVYRTYFPRFSKGSSLNVGFNYFHSTATEPFYNLDYWGIYYFGTNMKYSGNLISVPVYMQENLLNKNIRPFLMGGLAGSYYKGVYENGASRGMAGSSPNDKYRFSWVYGAGIEANFYKGFMAKVSYLYESYDHHVLFGLAYALRTK